MLEAWPHQPSRRLGDPRGRSLLASLLQTSLYEWLHFICFFLLLAAIGTTLFHSGTAAVRKLLRRGRGRRRQRGSPTAKSAASLFVGSGDVGAAAGGGSRSSLLLERNSWRPLGWGFRGSVPTLSPTAATEARQRRRGDQQARDHAVWRLRSVPVGAVPLSFDTFCVTHTVGARASSF